MSTKKQYNSDINGEESEPKENDRLATEESNVHTMDKNNGQPNDTKKSWLEVQEDRYRRYRTHFKSNKNHLIILILAVVILVLVLLTIILTIKLSVRREVPREYRCETSDCLRAATSVVSALNSSYDPCHDFWSYACSGWITKNAIPDNKGSWTVNNQIKDKIQHELRHYIDLIDQGIHEDDPQAKVKRFYQSCLNVEDIEYNSITTLKYEIKEIGGWSLLNSWSFQSWDRTKVIERLHTKYGVYPYFQVSVGPDDLDPNQPFIIKIEPSGLGLPSKNHYFDAKYEKLTESYKNFMRELAKLFNAQSIQANQFAENMFSYEKRIAEITPDLQEYEEPNNYLKKRYSIRELMSIAPSIKWLSLLQSYFPNSQLNEGTRVLVAFESYLRNISHIISTTDNGAVNDYLMWRFTSTYSPYLSRAFRLIYNEFHQTVNGVETTKIRMAEERWEFCLRVTSKFLGHALGSMFVKNKLTDRLNQSNGARSNVINYIKSSILENVNTFVWANTDEAREVIKRKVRQMEILMSQPNFILKNQIDKYYNEFIVQNSFYQNLLNGINFLNRKHDILLKSRSAVTDYSWKILPQDVNIAYEYAGNRLTIAAGFLQTPLFDTNLPVPIQFASLGFHVATHMLRAFDLVGLEYGIPDFRLSTDQTWITPEGRQNLDNRLECLLKDLQNLSDKTQWIYPNLTLSQTYIDIGALNIAFDAYNNYVSEKGEEGQLSGVYLNSQQLFYVSFAQSMCQSIRPQKSIIKSEVMTTLPSELRVATVLRHSYKFAEAFGCPETATMRAQSSCQLWH
ncbi:endothelin-converting enzyme 1-like [Oppia nitens]|uniref:endothelin-converting enzyme 1-like n=1 Tax=Oppia nitens TaxID=1686743 RepID=UPI0023D9B8B0|nr:endothelin-converting enzyme 1-like [Oppia nitens]